VERVFYLCGPPAMVTSIVNVLKTLQVPASKIRMENFSGY
jgi:Na+-transporting NADH:ubiquinone oxidoreductase subunit NqrF